MNQYTTLSGQLKRCLTNFSEKLCVGLSLPKFKFITDMLLGLLINQNIMLSNIARSLNEEISLKKTVERLSRNLTNFDKRDELIDNYIESIKNQIDEYTIFSLDPGDIHKKYSRKQEGLCKIWDASDKKSVRGYKLVEVVALTHKTKLPVPVYTSLHSTNEDDIGNQTAENLKALEHLGKHFGHAGIRVMDRAFDDVKIYEHCFQNTQKFIVRAKKNRLVIYNGELWNIEDLANTFKGKIKLTHTDKYGKKHTLRIWHIQVQLPEVEGKTFTLVIVHGYDKKDPEPCMLLTNMDGNGKQKSQRILKTYLMRWRVEEYYRFKKVQFDLENIRVLSLESLKTLNLLVSMLTGWLSLLSAKRGESLLLERVWKYAKRIYQIPQFTLYVTADGIFEIFSKTCVRLKKASEEKSKIQQLTLLEPSRSDYYAA